MTETLPLTGERTAPGIWQENYWYARHEAAYRWVTGLWTADGPAVRGRVLDAGCGEGYGADLLRRSGASSVVALDYDRTALGHAARAYPGLACVRGNVVRLALADGAFDLVVSLQTIEHLWDQPAFVAECARVLRPGGLLVLSTPNRLTFPPGNWYHSHELTAGELTSLVAGTDERLEIIELAALRHGPRLAAWEAVHGSCVEAQLATDASGWDDPLSGLVASVTATDFALAATTPSGAADSLDLLLVARKPAPTRFA